MAALLHWENVKVRHLPSETSKTNNNRKYSTAWAEAWQSPCHKQAEEDDEAIGKGLAPTS